MPPFSRLLFLGTLLPALGADAGATPAAPLVESSGSFSCTYKDFGRCTEGSASVVLQAGQVQSVAFSASFCRNKTQAEGSCRVEVRRGGPYAWADQGRQVTVRMPDPRHPNLDDEFSVLLDDARIVLDFSESQPANRCQGGGDLPEKIVLEPGSQRCAVSW